MYLARLEIENFRIFGSREDGRHLDFDLDPGLTLIVGENDSGKTCLIDAIRLLVGTSPIEYFPVTRDDFHVSSGRRRASNLKILGEFRGLSLREAAAFLEHLSVEGTGDKSRFFLRLWLTATLDETTGQGARRSPVQWEIRAGADEEGKRMDGQVRELLRATYLKPLRDAINELVAKRGSRLSQILQAHPNLKGQDVNDWDPDASDVQPSTLVGIMTRADQDLRTNPVIKGTEGELNEKYLVNFGLGTHPLKGRIGVQAQGLRQILERMALSLVDQPAETARGLGIHNLLFMATEFLALAATTDPELPLLLIEEPEAHLHPQLQMRLIEYLRQQAKKAPTSPQDQFQIVLTTHSPNLASKIGLRHLTVMYSGKAYRMAPQHTRLEASDYAFLERFLDVTKANLFFASGLLIVEGDAEALLLPALAEAIGRPLTKYGVSIVNVGHRGLFRYSRIFQRANKERMPTNVACVADRDIPPSEASRLLREDRKTEADLSAEEIAARVKELREHDGGSVRTFISPRWTFEFDLAMTDIGEYLHLAISLAKSTSRSRSLLENDRNRAVIKKALREYRQWRQESRSNEDIACDIYAPLFRGQASKAETAHLLAQVLRRPRVKSLRATLPSYLVEAIDFATGGLPSESAPTGSPRSDSQ